MVLLFAFLLCATILFLGLISYHNLAFKVIVSYFLLLFYGVADYNPFGYYDSIFEGLFRAITFKVMVSYIFGNITSVIAFLDGVALCITFECNYNILARSLRAIIAGLE